MSTETQSVVTKLSDFGLELENKIITSEQSERSSFWMDMEDIPGDSDPNRAEPKRPSAFYEPYIPDI